MAKVVTWMAPYSGDTIDLTPEQESELKRNGVWPRDARGEEFCQVRMGLHGGEPADIDTATGRPPNP